MDVTDTSGGSHTLAYRSWANGKSRMYLLEGVRDLQAKYGIGVGDVLVFRYGSRIERNVRGKGGGQGRAAHRLELIEWYALAI